MIALQNLAKLTVGNAQNPHRQEPRVLPVVDRHGGDRYSAGHLHNAKQRIQPI